MEITARLENREGHHSVSLETNGVTHALSIAPKAAGAGSSVNGGELLFLALGSTTFTRQVSLNEMESGYWDGPAHAMVGTVTFDGAGNATGDGKMWSDPVTETPALGSTEVWEIYNFTEDAHPIHLHQVQFQILERQGADGAVRPPEAGETGYKDMVIAYPGEITRIKSHFDKAGLYVWHCHIIDHEDNEMMRPMQVG